MIYTTLRRFIRRRCQMAVALAIMPLAILNGLPIAEGCICADGHYEPVCRAHLGQSNDDHSCCAKHSGRMEHACCAGMHTCHLATEKSNGQQRLGDRCCTPLVHQAVPVVSATPQFDSPDQTAVWNAVAIESPTFLSLAMHGGHCVEVDTGTPPNDLVVTLQRLII
jgi:hypothetical protein